MPKRSLFALVLGLLAAAVLAAAEPDILIADFEWESWEESGWTVTGTAFGPGPARGTLPRQMQVTGYQGERLVNSFHGGDGPTGMLTSPPFTINRKYLNFLIGGGGYEGKTCLNLLVDGKVVRTATGPNTKPGGSEALDWHAWDVADLASKEAVLQVVDQATGGWGHINVDHVVLSNRKAEVVTIAREWMVDRPYLHLPVKTGAAKRLMRFVVDGAMVRQFEIELSDAEPEFWTYTEVDAYTGKRLRVELDRAWADSTVLDALVLADRLPDADNLYRERLRPQFHFSPARGWTNDPNGMVYYDGEYHLFFQHNPYGVNWGNMTWGHAISPDMIHWRQLPDAIHPDELGTIFSGSGVVDRNNTTGWQTGEHKPIVAVYTSAGGTNAESRGQPFTQSIAYSTDRGRTFTKYDGNPVLEHIAGGNRDPKVIWHEPTKQWVMILYLQRPQFALFGSPNLKQWTKLSELDIPGGHECPDLFELPVDGDPENTRWVVWEAAGRYAIGRFDGKVFTPESDVLDSCFGANDYAAQTFSNLPGEDGRCIQIAWMRGGRYPNMPFNQQMTVPRVLSLRTTADGVQLFIEPVEELKVLREREHRRSDVALDDSPVTLGGLAGELFDIEAVFEIDKAETVGIEVRGHRIEYSAAANELTALGRKAPLKPDGSRISLRILVDRTSVEVFANKGRVQMANCFLPDDDKREIAVYATGGAAKAASVAVWELRPIWSATVHGGLSQVSRHPGTLPAGSTVTAAKMGLSRVDAAEKTTFAAAPRTVTTFQRVAR
ncbi:MAG: glycoside hydrolase family 32 protein [Thermoguttaceae bacterium]|jgi:fructan beta-fructosidase|nr:glycoside hydrolase family 32 protein [Thermoguttaceae bacterium]